MTFTRDYVLVASALAAVLILATLVGWTLSRRPLSAQSRAKVDNLNARVHSWWVMIALLAVTVQLGEKALIIVFAAASFAALHEFLRASTISALFLAVPLQYAFLWMGWYGWFVLFLPASALLLRTKRMALLLCVYGISHVPALATLSIPGYAGRETMLVVFLLVVTQSSDVLQYVWGQLLGRHKIAPVISPSKTVEGLVGGVLSATGVGALLTFITPFTAPQAAAFAFVIAVAGFAGGLVLSAIKRQLGIKDWGSLIKGHGGVLDRLDSLCLSAPVFFHLVRYFFAN